MGTGRIANSVLFWEAAGHMGLMPYPEKEEKKKIDHIAVARKAGSADEKNKEERN